MIGLSKSVGLRPHRIQLATLGDPVPDGDGGFHQDLVPLSPPAVFAEVRPATAHDLQRYGTALATCSHVVTIPYHPQVTPQTQITHRGRTLYVTGVINPDDRDRELTLYCSEVVA